MIVLDGEGDYGEGEVVDCVLEGVRGPVATVAACGEVGAHVEDRLRVGALGFMTFEHFGASVALRGAARAVSDSGAIEFVVLDGVELAERRTALRVALETAVRAVSLADGVGGAAIETVTADLSTGGALFRRKPGLGEGPWQIELFLPGDPAPVRCTAVLCRESGSHLGVAFAEVQDADLIRLERTVADHPGAPAVPAAEAVRGPAPAVAAAVTGMSGVEGVGVASREADFELIVESIPQIVFIASRYGSTEYFNQRGTDYMGLSREQTRGWAWTAMIHRDDVERVVAGWREAAAGEAAYEIEYRLRRYDGEFRWHRARALPVRAGGGGVVKWIGTLIDIEDQRRVEQSLRAAQRESAESLSLLEALQATAPAGLGFVDRDFRLVHMNEMLAAANGAPREQHLGRTLAEVIPELWSKLESAFRRVLETGEAVLNREMTRELPGDPGRVRTALTSFYPVSLEGEVIGIGIVVLDITQRKETAQD